MAREEFPINPAIVTWARERAGYTLVEARSKFKHIEAWEIGESHPPYPQLEGMADKFKVPVSVFFFPNPPDIEPISESFRTLPEPQFEQIPRRVRLLLRKAKAMQISLAELANGRNPADRLITRDLSFAVDVPAEKVADKVREYLGITLDQQTSWTRTDKALDVWRSRLHDVGVFVFKDAFQEEDYSGFCLYDNEFPIIYVNNSTAKSRQIFTLFHELAHLLYHTSGVDKFRDDYIKHLRGDARKIEVLCNRFAARFLVPTKAFDHEFNGLEASRESAELLSRRFCVSREVIYRIFLDRGLIDQNEYEKGAKAFAEHKSGGGEGGDYCNNQIAYLGSRYIGLAFRQYYADQIDSAQLAEYLNIAPKNIAPLEERFLRRSA